MRVRKLLLSGTILYETQPTDSDLSEKPWRLPYASFTSSCPESMTFLQTTPNDWYVQNSQWKSEIASGRTQANKPWVPGISQTTTAGATGFGPSISPQTTRPFALYAPAILASTFLILKQANLFPPQAFALALCLEHFIPDSLYCKQRGQVEWGQRKSKKQTHCRRVRDPGVEKETCFPHPVVQGKGGQPEAKVDIEEAFCQQGGCEAGPRRDEACHISTCNSRVLLSWQAM